MPRIPTRAIFPVCCASAASGAARRPPVKAQTNVRRSNGSSDLAASFRPDGGGRPGQLYQWGRVGSRPGRLASRLARWREESGCRSRSTAICSWPRCGGRLPAASGELAGRPPGIRGSALGAPDRTASTLDATDGSSSLAACRKQRTDRRVTSDVRTWLGALRTARDLGGHHRRHFILTIGPGTRKSAARTKPTTSPIVPSKSTSLPIQPSMVTSFALPPPTRRPDLSLRTGPS